MDFKSLYGTSNQGITVTLASLANAAARGSAAISNTSDLFLDALVQLKIKTGASGTSATGWIDIYAFGSADGGTTYPEGCGSDGAITVLAATNLRKIGTLFVAANATTYITEPMSVASAFGGVLPEKWGIVIANNSGGALDSTEGNHAKFYQGVAAQSL